MIAFELPPDLQEFLATPWPRVIMWFTTIVVLIVIGVYIASKFRGTTGESTIGASEMLTNYREMHSKGELSDEEFRTIKAKLARKLQQELNDSDKPG